MPTGELPKEGKELWERVYDEALKGFCKGDKECAARIAWTAVKNAGWRRDEDGNWHKSIPLSEFSFVIVRASYDKKTNRMNWRAVASDTDVDSFGDRMTLSLFQDFIDRIERHESPPEQYCSKFWKGGMPYLSLSHYPDLGGKAVPGMVEKVYIDGNRLKATGYFFDTPLGRACFRSVRKDLLYSSTSHPEGRIRISIAFLDYAHRHRSSGIIFDRLNSKESVCGECVKGIVGGSRDGLEFLRGHLIHLALTRVPVNSRTLIEAEVDKSMAIKTRIEDALSIVGDDAEAKEQIEEIEKEASLIGRSELVIKSDADELEEEGAEPELVVEAKTKTVDGEKYPPSDFLVVEDEDKPSTWHLQVKRHGKPDHNLMAAAKAALTSPGGHRGNRYEGPQRKAAIAKLKRLYESEGMEWEEKSEVERSDVGNEYRPFGAALSVVEALGEQKEKSRFADLWFVFQSVLENIGLNDEMDAVAKAEALARAVEEFKELVADKESQIVRSLVSVKEALDAKQEPPHPLDGLFEKLRGAYDSVIGAEGITPEDALYQIQTPFNEFGAGLVAAIKANVKTPPPDPNKTILEQIDALNKKIAEISAALQQRPESRSSGVPVRRSFAPPPSVRPVQPPLQNKPGGVKSIAEIVESTTI